ncbi:unnamed protein product [Pleuronectes platessa]|uniref:Uncharacterized protein n=1 Tax=Pleuronectes platessa TaxID=8262 RepID=A0A9N7UC36_PLEPL|nr:unnamed protein product [Pleuronectes platessa]
MGGSHTQMDLLPAFQGHGVVVGEEGRGAESKTLLCGHSVGAGSCRSEGRGICSFVFETLRLFPGWEFDKCSRPLDIPDAASDFRFHRWSPRSRGASRLHCGRATVSFGGPGLSGLSPSRPRSLSSHDDSSSSRVIKPPPLPMHPVPSPLVSLRLQGRPQFQPQPV